jgi:hypothetical protein
MIFVDEGREVEFSVCWLTTMMAEEVSEKGGMERGGRAVI